MIIKNGKTFHRTCHSKSRFTLDVFTNRSLRPSSDDSSSVLFVKQALKAR